jgi:hypothetical protein
MTSPVSTTSFSLGSAVAMDVNPTLIMADAITVKTHNLFFILLFPFINFLPKKIPKPVFQVWGCRFSSTY